MNLRPHAYRPPGPPEQSAFARYEPREQVLLIPVIIAGGQLFAAGTSAAAPMDMWPEPFACNWKRTAVVDCAWDAPADIGGIAGISSDATSRAISELRRTSGLTWEQLGQLFGVSRRSVHFWASGRPMNAVHERRLFEILDIVRQADHGDARRNRAALLAVSAGRAPFDLLVAGAFNEARAQLGRGETDERVALRELDATARAERTPLSPEDLIDAMNDTVHRDTGRGRAARTVRNMRRESTG